MKPRCCRAKTKISKLIKGERSEGGSGGPEEKVGQKRLRRCGPPRWISSSTGRREAADEPIAPHSIKHLFFSSRCSFIFMTSQNSPFLFFLEQRPSTFEIRSAQKASFTQNAKRRFQVFASPFLQFSLPHAGSHRDRLNIWKDDGVAEMSERKNSLFIFFFPPKEDKRTFCSGGAAVQPRDLDSTTSGENAPQW